MSTLCAHCGFQNPPGMRFCGNCGTRLQNASPTGSLSGGVSPEQLGVLIGPDLTQRLQQAGIEAAGQRRNVTVLFADLTGSTALSERLDPEDLFDLIQRYIQLLISSVYKYEGIVDKLTGDGLMALFGAPIALENNAERAARAALDMQTAVHAMSRALKDQLGAELSMRVGLHSGTVIVGGVGTNLLMDYTAIGDTVNLAHRIEEAAAPGTILISEVVYRQIRPLFDCQQVSVLNPKGIAHPVTAYRVLDAKKLPGRVRGIEGLNAPMIGRDHELGQLYQARRDLLTEKIGQFALITGEAGLGKSRLTSEFISTLDSEQVLLLEGHSLAYRRTISYWLILDVLYHYLNLARDAPPEVTARRLHERIYQVLGSQAEELLPYLEHLFGLPYSDPETDKRLSYLDAGQLRQQIFLAVRDLLLVESYHKPLIIVLEDLHWADEASLELVRFLIQPLARAPIFILGITRQVSEGLLERIITLAQKTLQDHFRLIALQQLPQADSETLLLNLLSLTEFPPTLRAEIIQRAAGIPFYLEEILRMLIDQGVLHYADNHWQVHSETESGLGVPENLQELILARFDRLDPSQRRLLQVASVIGVSFSFPLLDEALDAPSERVTQATLESLVARDFVRPTTPAPDANPENFTFRHILMSDAIYHTLLRRERRKLHGRVGQAIEYLYAERLESQIELLAYHYRWSEHTDRALHYLILAGKRAAQNNANGQARLNFEAAIELLALVEHTPEQAYQAHMGLGDALAFAGDYPEARAEYLTGLEVIEQSQFALERAELLRKTARTYERLGDHDEALAYLEKAKTQLHTGSLLSGRENLEKAQILNDVGWINFRRGNFSEAQELLSKALTFVKDTNAFAIIASIYNRLAGIAYNQGDWDEAVHYLRQSIALREDLHDTVGLASSFINLGILELELGEFDNALINLTRSYELKTRLGQSEGIAIALSNLGWVRIQRGELAEAKVTLTEALDLARQIGYTALITEIQKNIGEIFLRTKKWQDAHTVLVDLAENLEESKVKDQLIDVYRLLGEVEIAKNNHTAAKRWEQKAVQILSEIDEEKELSTYQRGELRRFQGILAIQLGDYSQAQDLLKECSLIFQKLRSRLYQGRLDMAFGKLAQTLGNSQDARKFYQQAVTAFQSVGAKLDEELAVQAYEQT